MSDKKLKTTEKINKVAIIIALLFFIMTTGCFLRIPMVPPSPTPHNSSSPTYTPTFIFIPIFTSTPIPTPTPTNTPTPSPTPTPLPPIARTILLENGNEKTNKTKPQISIFAENAVYMAFSGNSLEWTEWIPYTTLYNNLDLNSSPGCIEGDGEKSIYVKFKNKYNQESNIISDTIILDTTPPNPPIVNGSITPTRKDIQILSGTKDKNASLWIGNTQIIPINDDTTWSYTISLSEGENIYEFYSKDDLSNESNHTIVTIIYDPTVYVSPNGSDEEGTGTETKPYKTITYAISKAREGDALFIKNGLYEENLIIDKPLIIQGESKEGVIIKSNPSPPQDIHSVVRIASSDVSIEDITIDGNNTPIEIYEGVTVISNEDMTTNNILLMNLIVSNFSLSSSSGIHFSSNTSGIINSSIVKNNTKGIRAGGVPGATLIISDCNILYNKEGVYIEDEGIVNAGDETDNAPGRNNIYGNTSHGMANYSTNILFAKNNWWGDPDGPKYPYNSNNENCGDWAYWPTNGKKIEILPYTTLEFIR